ncbi:serine hydrolase domain-containing protein [Microcystis aeruginosa]|uniref:serine hydrolase domain-containing protein n=1 Tax=Microcystis aeruginosa TaxID=1126 RepID=UPI001330889E|nr:serine hydrolase domain-containing protein [Microcystis aeruginosa]
MLTEKADAIVNDFMQQNKIPGLVLGVVKNGKIVVEKGCGVISLDSGMIPNENTIFNIGSVSKPLTAFGIMYLVDQGKLRLDDVASQYIPNLPPSWRKITVRQFMSHQSGIPQFKRNLPTFNEMLASTNNLPLTFAPGTRNEYNNFNYVVIGKVIEIVSGQPYLDFMRQKIFLPLGMTRTGFGLRDANTATGYINADRNGQLLPVDQVMPPGGLYNIPSGFMQSTLGDLLKFYNAIRKNKLLSPASYRQMLEPTQPNLPGSPGWMINYLGGVEVVSKNGSVKGYRSMFLFVPDRDHAVIFLYNFNSGNNPGKIISSFTNSLLREVCNFHPLRN